MNTASSRSHAIFTIELKTFFLQTQTIYTSQLNIVDLAGSERSKGHHVLGQGSDRLAEAGSINRSLMVLGQCIEVLRNQRKSSPHGFGIVPFRQNKLTELLFGNAILKRDSRAVMIVNLNVLTAYEENVGILRYASLAHEIEALPASELGGTLSRSLSCETRAEEGIVPIILWLLMTADWNEKLAQMEFLFREEECKRIDVEEKYIILEHEMIQQSLEMEEKMAEMERMYMYRLLEEVPSPDLIVN
jgi:kinesin family member 20